MSKIAEKYGECQIRDIFYRHNFMLYVTLFVLGLCLLLQLIMYIVVWV